MRLGYTSDVHVLSTALDEILHVACVDFPPEAILADR